MSTATANGFTIDLEGISDVAWGMEELAKQIGVPIKLVCMDQLRLAVVDAINHTPPKTKAAGVRKIQRAVGSLFFDLDRKDIVASWQARKDGQRYAARIFRTKTDSVFGINEQLIRPTGTGMRQFHEQFLASKTRPGVTHIGKWKVLGKMGVSGAALRQHLNMLKARVGMLKASWLPALDKLSTALHRGLVAPSWVTAIPWRHGSVNTSSMSESGDGHISATNSSRAASRHVQSAMPFIIRRRQNDINTALHGHPRLQQMIDQFNAGKM